MFNAVILGYQKRSFNLVPQYLLLMRKMIIPSKNIVQIKIVPFAGSLWKIDCGPLLSNNPLRDELKKDERDQNTIFWNLGNCPEKFFNKHLWLVPGIYYMKYEVEYRYNRRLNPIWTRKTSLSFIEVKIEINLNPLKAKAVSKLAPYKQLTGRSWGR